MLSLHLVKWGAQCAAVCFGDWEGWTCGDCVSEGRGAGRSGGRIGASAEQSSEREGEWRKGCWSFTESAQWEGEKQAICWTKCLVLYLYGWTVTHFHWLGIVHVDWFQSVSVCLCRRVENRHWRVRLFLYAGRLWGQHWRRQKGLSRIVWLSWMSLHTWAAPAQLVRTRASHISKYSNLYLTTI